MSGDAMRYLGYALALVIGVAALIVGITTHSGVLGGAAIGWLVASIVNIVSGMAARVEAQEDGLFSIFTVPWYLWLIDIALIVIGAVIGGIVVR
jgi:hypothetical protein